MKFHFFLNKRKKEKFAPSKFRKLSAPCQTFHTFRNVCKFQYYAILPIFVFASLMRCKTKAENKRQIMDKRNDQISPNGLCFIKIRFILFLQTKTAFNWICFVAFHVKPNNVQYEKYTHEKFSTCVMIYKSNHENK